MVEDGRVILGRDAGDAFEEPGRTRILSRTTYAMPAVADGRPYARDFHNVVCLDLKSRCRRRAATVDRAAEKSSSRKPNGKPRGQPFGGVHPFTL